MNTTRWLAPLLLASSLVAACRGDLDEAGQQSQTASSSIVEGSAEAVAVIRFLNDVGTTLTVLDEDVPLPSNAAANLIAHRDGPDGQLGTADDDLFDDVAEVLGVRQIGPARLAAIVAFAEANGFVPSGSDELGVYDDVSFSVDEAAAALDLANTASESTLDIDVALDSRAVTSILAARPIASVLELSELYFVGRSALEKLKGFTAPPLATVGDDCMQKADCENGLHCLGIPYDGSPAIGKCADLSNVPGANEDCGHHMPACGDGLACAGTSVYGGSGYCRPLYMFGTFETNESVAIPDDDPSGASVDVVVYGLASVPEDIMLTLYIDHPRPADLVVTLSSTNGSSDVIWDHESSPEFYLPSLGIERDNEVNGRFTLHVVDTVSGEAGQLNGFKMFVSSRFD